MPDSSESADTGFTFSDDEDSDERYLRFRKEAKKKKEEQSKKGAHFLPFLMPIGACTGILTFNSWRNSKKNECEEPEKPLVRTPF